ncbi:hypothetical protein GCM10011335_08510 [Aureimonas glaciei]|uniref:Uncharacterized protein n=1 Tax=Aureimonas glaciei TaxID=1776957 RepID=A0A916XTZ8_9HYPH|nr:hypothetical protein GCM10011335_08510 [Aureimonas glaciei]
MRPEFPIGLRRHAWPDGAKTVLRLFRLGGRGKGAGLRTAGTRSAGRHRRLQRVDRKAVAIR